MEKIKLDLDELTVQSFSTTGADPQQRGTVRGQESLETDFVHNTCWSCDGTCNSCACTADCGPRYGSPSFLASHC